MLQGNAIENYFINVALEHGKIPKRKNKGDLIAWQPNDYFLKKVVVKVDVHDNKHKRKVLKTISGLSGIESLEMDMRDNKLTVVGHVDPIDIVRILSNCCHAEIVAVGPVKGY
ncbi:hypothetical protein L1887_15483 [Cichorium endivia]|nr:hypothetical protein L1887_15483 [Cichorium endivia]